MNLNKEEVKEYRKGRYNLSATVFVPYDCKNNCPFCTSKYDYRDMSSFKLDEIISKILLLNENNLIREFVITGGEPFANLAQLKEIVNACEKDIYINTTLPMDGIDKAIDFVNSNDKIKGINISRYIGFDFKGVASLEEIDWIKKGIRINTVMMDKLFSSDKFLEFCYRYGKKKRDINLRADYRSMTLDNLKIRDDISRFLEREFDYISTESCMVCNSEYYSANDEFIVAYHRGLEHSCVDVGNKFYVNDVIVKQDGSVYKDWDCVLDRNFEEWILRDGLVKSKSLKR